MATVTVKELKEFLERHNDDDKVFMASGFDKYKIDELKDTGNDGYPLDGYVVLKGDLL